MRWGDIEREGKEEEEEEEEGDIQHDKRFRTYRHTYIHIYRQRNTTQGLERKQLLHVYMHVVYV